MPKISDLVEELALPVDADQLAIDDDSDNNTAKRVSKLNLLKLTQANIDTNTAAIAGLGGAVNWLFRNAIINPIDENMVDQYDKDGDVIVSANEYFIDRWKMNSLSQSPTFNKGSNSIELVADGTVGSSFIKGTQIMEDVNYKKLEGLETTFSAKITSNNINGRFLVNVSGTFFSSPVITTVNVEELLSVTVSAANMTSITSLEVVFAISDNVGSSVSITIGDFIRMSKAQATIGIAAIEYSPRFFANELELCMRYFKLINNYDSERPFAMAFQDGGTLRGFMPMDSLMRASPTMSVKTGSVRARNSTGGSVTGPLSLSSFATTINGLDFTASGGSIGVSQTGQIFSASVATQITLDSEL